VHSVIVHPKDPWQGFEVEVKGKLAALVGGRVFPEAHYNSGSYVVAGGRFTRFPPPRKLQFLQYFEPERPPNVLARVKAFQFALVENEKAPAAAGAPIQTSSNWQLLHD
jgi:hypothetical protein